MLDELDTWMRDGVKCPHCGHEMKDGEFDCESLSWREDENREVSCLNCDKSFTCRVFVISYSRVSKPLSPTNEVSRED